MSPISQKIPRVVVIGAGIGGLSAAAVLARAGLEVVVLEAHVFPGGCASTFYHQGYRFDAGATLAGGFSPGGPMEQLAGLAGIHAWPALSASEAMHVHLPGNFSFRCTGGPERWEARREAFGEAGVAFWRWQEETAGRLWSLAQRLPPWPPQSIHQGGALAHTGLSWLAAQPSLCRLPALAADAFRSVAAHLPSSAERLRQLVDAQLLISAQTTSQQANALYGAAALDLPRRGVVHLIGGMGAIAKTLVQALRRNGGQLYLRQEAVRIVTENGHPVAVETRRGESFPANLVIANLSAWDAARLLENIPSSRVGKLPPDGWGAFVVYLGLDAALVPIDFPLHHQVVVEEPLAEGNSAFLSLSPAWDASRAPEGSRAVTLSTHTRLSPWWELYNKDRPAYAARKAAYMARLLAAAEVALPGLRQAARLALPGTPVTFQRFTRRSQGWVGGFPQTNLFRARAPRLAPGVWLVGDSIFPGQSTAAVALGGLRIAQTILASQNLRIEWHKQEIMESKNEDRHHWQWPGRLDRRLRDGDARGRPGNSPGRP